LWGLEQESPGFGAAKPASTFQSLRAWEAQAFPLAYARGSVGAVEAGRSDLRAGPGVIHTYGRAARATLILHRAGGFRWLTQL
jgi:hypothetical protein